MCSHPGCSSIADAGRDLPWRITPDISCSKNAGNFRFHPLVHLYLTAVRQRNDTFEIGSIRVEANMDKNAVGLNRFNRFTTLPSNPYSFDMIVSGNFLHPHSDMHFHLRVFHQPILENRRCIQLLHSFNDNDFRSNFR